MTEERDEGDLANEPDDALDDPVFEELFAALRATASRPAPPMSPALTMLLAPGATGRRRRARGATVGLAVVGVLAGGVGAAAATGHLQRPAPVTRVADSDDDPGTTAPERPGPTDAVGPPSSVPATDADPEVSDDDTPDATGDDDTTTHPTRRPRASDDDSPETGETGSDDDGEHGTETEDGDEHEDDGSDDSGVEEPGDDEHEDDGDEVEDGSGEDGGQSEVGDDASGEDDAG